MLIKQNIVTALDNGLDETQIVEATESTHLELRQYCRLHCIPLDYSFVSESLVIELLDHAEWKAPKLASRYNMTIPVMQRILLGTYPLTVKRKIINKKTLTDLVNLRCSVQEIAKHLDVSIYYVRKALEKHSLTVQRGKLTTAQYDEIVHDLLHCLTPQKDLAEAYGVDPSMISYIKKQVVNLPERKKYIKADPLLVVQLVDAGYTQQSVAKQLNIAQATVSRLYREHKHEANT